MALGTDIDPKCEDPQRAAPTYSKPKSTERTGAPGDTLTDASIN